VASREPAERAREASEPVTGANVWVDTNGGACTRSAAAGPYRDATACPTLDAAYQAAQPGDAVLITCRQAACDLGDADQTVHGDPSKTGREPVAFGPAPGKSLTTGKLAFQGAATDGGVAPSHIAVDGRRRWAMDELYLYPGAADIVVRGVKAAKFYIRCAFAVTVEGSEFTDRTATGVPTISSAFGQPVPEAAAGDCGPGAPARDVTLRGNDFHDIWKPVGCGNDECHRECLHVQGVDGLRIEGNRFHGCLGNTAAISFNIHDGSTIRGVEVVGNSFARSYEDIDDAGCPGPDDCLRRSGVGAKLSIHFSASTSDGCEAVIRGNRFAGGGRHISAECAERGAGIVVERNVFDQAPGCELEAASYTWRGNVARAGVWEPECDDGGNRIEAG
jgi:hypothetical protein